MSSTAPSRCAGAPRVLLLAMPWSDLRTGVGICTLKAVLQRDGLPADTRFPNIQMAKRVESHWYGLLTNFCGPRYSPEILFTPYVFSRDPVDFVNTVLPAFYDGVFQWFDDTRGLMPPQGVRDAVPRVTSDICLRHVPEFLHDLMTGIEWERYDIVGFSLMSGQVLPSIALARRIKAKWPETRILLGGPSCEGGMGESLLRSFDCIDVVVPGEADLTITPLVRAIRNGESLSAIPGLVFRDGDAVVSTGRAPLLANLDEVPMPDFDDYMDEVKAVEGLRVFLHYETSRGCWWGEKHQCSFCGLNCKGLAYRRKSAARGVGEILALSARHSVNELRATDTIFDLSYFKDFVPTLAAVNVMRAPEARLQLFYETKSNLTKEQLRQMKAAGLTELQPGIESLNDGLLELMNKGNCCLHQLQFIKWADELGIQIGYGILWGVPGERAEHYKQMHGLVDAISHLTPPQYISPLFLERFSPYFADPSRYGIRDIEPYENDRMIFPDPRIDLNRLLFRFRFSFDQSEVGLLAAREGCLSRLRQWRDTHQPGALRYRARGNEVEILDKRGDTVHLYLLDGLLGRIYQEMDAHRPFQALVAADPSVRPGALRAAIEWLRDHRLVYWDDRRDRGLALAVAGLPTDSARTGEEPVRYQGLLSAAQ